MSGIIYGVGVGPGDPELMTAQAIRIIKECPVVGMVAGSDDECTAYNIAIKMVPELKNKKKVALKLPMTKDKKALAGYYDRLCDELTACLDLGEDIAFLNLGDPTIYGSYMSIHTRLKARGYESGLVSGVPSFCSVAAKLDMSIGRRNAAIHIIPGAYKGAADDIKNYLIAGDSVVIMKSASQFNELRRMIINISNEFGITIGAITDCGMPTEKIYKDALLLPEEMGYFTTIILQPQ